MGTGAKIAIGCGCVLLLAGALVLGVLGWGAWWVKGKVADAAAGVDKMTAQSEEIDRYARIADANPYSPPQDGVVPEARLLKFLEARKQVHAVYGRYETALADLAKKAESTTDKLGLGELWRAGGTLAEMAGTIRLEQMKALAEVGMSEAEYRDIQLAVYKSAWAAQAETGSGKLPAEAVSEGMAEAGQEAGAAVRSGIEAARRQGVPGADQLTEDDARRLQERMKEMGESAGESLYVPRANVELFRKHEAEIKKYAMHGLAFLGL